jgi:DNA polymerase-3 subunit delta
VQRQYNYEAIEGTAENVFSAMERVKTYSMLSDTKVVSFLDSKLFASKKGGADHLNKALAAWEEKAETSASRYFLLYLKQVKLQLEDVEKDDAAYRLGLTDNGKLSDIRAIAEHCRDKNLTSPADADAADIFYRNIQKGFPKSNFLLITTDHVDKRHRLYKLIKQTGCVIDCAVPKGERKADKLAQDEVLRLTSMEILAAADKSMDNNVFMALTNLTGFDLRTFRQNLEKLVNFTGCRRKILISDVEQLLQRTKKDPIFEFTNAVASRNLEKALFLLQSLLNSEMHPLQILAALANQTRKLMVVREFIDSSKGNLWTSNMTYPNFVNRVIPVLKAYEDGFSEVLHTWGQTLSQESVTAKGRKKKITPKTDLIVVKNPKNAYPVYQLFKSADRFSMNELLDAIKSLSLCDIEIKSTPQPPKLIMESVLIRICGMKKAPTRSNH